MTIDIEKTINAFFAHWQNLPRENGTTMPHLTTFLDNIRSEFQPYVVLVDVDDGDRLSLRVFGTGRLNSFGRDVKKINPLEIYAPDLRPTILKKVQSVLALPCGFRSSHRLRTEKGSDHIHTGVTLPLGTDDGEPQCVVNFLVSNDPVSHDDRKATVEELLTTDWVDIGAGIPDH